MGIVKEVFCGYFVWVVEKMGRDVYVVQTLSRV